MRINKWLATHTELSRRSADTKVSEKRVTLNGDIATLGSEVNPGDTVHIDGKAITPTELKTTTIILNKPIGYVCSRNGQGSKTIYELLPPKYQHLQSVGRLDKDSSGLLLMTNDGTLHEQLTHPRYEKSKVYEVVLDKPLTDDDVKRIEKGIELEDGISKLTLKLLTHEKWRLEGRVWQVSMHEGRNRQIRRTFNELGYTIQKLHRTKFGEYILGNTSSGSCIEL